MVWVYKFTCDNILKRKIKISSIKNILIMYNYLLEENKS